MAILISVISLIFSFYVFYTNKQFEKSKRKYDMFTPLYLDNLLIGIPIAYGKLNFINQDNGGIDEFNLVIRRVINEVRIIQFIDEACYEEWTQQLMDIEDFITIKANQNNYDDTHQANVLNELRAKLKILYKSILSADFKRF